MSTFASIVSLLSGAVALILRFFEHRTDRCKKLKKEIDRKEKELALCIKESRFTDSVVLHKELVRLYEEYNKCPEVLE